MSKVSKSKKVLRMVLTRGNLGSSYLYIIQVTEKSIITINNEVSTTVYDRASGRRRGTYRIGDGFITDLHALEDFLKSNGKEKNGVYTWNGRLSTRTNSRGEVVNPDVISMHLPYEDWFKQMNVEVITL